MKLKRYLVFAGYNYEEGGGWRDFVDSYDTLPEIKTRPKKYKSRWCLYYIEGWPYREWHRRSLPRGDEDDAAEWLQIVDSETGQSVEYPSD